MKYPDEHEKNEMEPYAQEVREELDFFLFLLKPLKFSKIGFGLTLPERVSP